MKSLFKIFVIGTDPCVIFLSNLDRVILLLLEVHASITFGVSHLRDPVKQVKGLFVNLLILYNFELLAKFISISSILFKT